MNSKRIETEEKIQAVPGIPCRPGIERKGRTYVFTAEVFPESKAELLLYERKDGEKILTVFPFPEESRQGNLLSLQVTGLTGTEVWYNFRIDGVVRQDPYAQSLCHMPDFGKAGEEEPCCRYKEDKFVWTDREFRPKLCQILFYIRYRCAVLPCTEVPK